MKTFARESSDKAQMQSRQLVESSMLEMKETVSFFEDFEFQTLELSQKLQKIGLKGSVYVNIYIYIHAYNIYYTYG